MHCPPDRDALAFPPGEIGYRRVDGDADAAKTDHIHQDPVGDFFLPLDVDEPEPVDDLPANEEIPP